MDKDSILNNYKKVVCFKEDGTFLLVKDKQEVTRMIENEEIQDSDLVIDLNENNLKIAKKMNFIKLE